MVPITKQQALLWGQLVDAIVCSLLLLPHHHFTGYNNLEEPKNPCPDLTLFHAWVLWCPWSSVEIVQPWCGWTKCFQVQRQTNGLEVVPQVHGRCDARLHVSNSTLKTVTILPLSDLNFQVPCLNGNMIMSHHTVLVITLKLGEYTVKVLLKSKLLQFHLCVSSGRACSFTLETLPQK